MTDPLRPARGILLGVVIGALIWALIFAAVSQAGPPPQPDPHPSACKSKPKGKCKAKRVGAWLPVVYELTIDGKPAGQVVGHCWFPVRGPARDCSITISWG